MCFTKSKYFTFWKKQDIQAKMPRRFAAGSSRYRTLIRLLYCIKLLIQWVSLTDKDVPPSLGAHDARLAEHVEELAAGIWRQLLEVGAHGVEHGLARGDRLVADVALFLERIVLGRVTAGIRLEVGHILGLLEFGPFLVVHRGHDGDPFVIPQGKTRRSWVNLGRLLEDIGRDTSGAQCLPAVLVPSRNAC